MDYNIYIHDATGNGGTSKTKSWTKGNNSPTSVSNSSNQKVQQIVTRTASAMNNPDSLISSGVGAMAKSIPWIAAAYIAVSTATKIAVESVNYVSRETGDYRESIQWANVLSTLNGLIHPFSTIKGFIENRQEISLYNKQAEQRRLLIGEGIINNVTRRV